MAGDGSSHRGGGAGEHPPPAPLADSRAPDGLVREARGGGGKGPSRVFSLNKCKGGISAQRQEGVPEVPGDRATQASATRVCRSA